MAEMLKGEIQFWSTAQYNPYMNKSEAQGKKQEVRELG